MTKDSSSNTTKTSKGASSMAELMARMGNSVQTLKKGDIVEGTIKKLTPSEILLDIEAKGDALVIEYDKQNMDNLLAYLKVGDKVKASVISPESEEGFPVVSLRRTLDDLVFGRFEDLSKNDQSFKVNILDSTRGGYFAETAQGIRGFLPNSQVLMGDDLVGKTLDVKIIEYDRSKKRVIFSQKATHYVMDPEKLKKIAKRDELVSGTVTDVTPYGIYLAIKVGSDEAEGFVHISELSYDRVDNINSLYQKGMEVKAQVLDLDLENRRVNLSVKKLEKDTFEDIKNKYAKEQKVKGKVKSVSSRGITLQVEAGVNGFIPSDKIPDSTTYHEGDEVNAEVSDFDMKRRVLVLSPILKAVPIGYR